MKQIKFKVFTTKKKVFGGFQETKYLSKAGMAEGNKKNESPINANKNTEPEPIDCSQIVAQSIMNVFKNSQTDGLKQPCYQMLNVGNYYDGVKILKRKLEEAKPCLII